MPEDRAEASPIESMVFAELSGDHVRETIRKLELRIASRFPGSGLGRVAAGLGQLAAAAEGDIEQLRKPVWLARFGAALGVLGMLAVAVGLIMIAIAGSLEMGGLSEFLQGIEAAANEVILLAVGLFFMLSIETRVKRRRALKALYRVRSIIHVVDMHQLTKDPEFFISPDMANTVSPDRTLTRFEMVRYLAYCSELFSLGSKVAALYLQHMNDAVVLEAVNDIESLATSLSQKVWQKIMILDTGMDIAAQGGVRGQ